MRAARRRSGALVLGGLLLAGTIATPLPAAAHAGAPRAATGSPAPDALSSTVDLGRYAVNGSVRAAAVDAATGNTYIGGDFTEIGVRTGSVAIVDPPGTSDGPIRSDSPEILGRVVAVFADDQPGDPGLFVVGRISAIDGVKVGEAPVQRLHRVGGDWVRDTGWAVQGDCTTGSGTFPIDGTWIATPTQLVYGAYAGPGLDGP